MSRYLKSTDTHRRRNIRKILIMGLPGAGETTLAEALLRPLGEPRTAYSAVWTRAQAEFSHGLQEFRNSQSGHFRHKLDIDWRGGWWLAVELLTFVFDHHGVV